MHYGTVTYPIDEVIVNGIVEISVYTGSLTSPVEIITAK